MTGLTASFQLTRENASVAIVSIIQDLSEGTQALWKYRAFGNLEHRVFTELYDPITY